MVPFKSLSTFSYSSSIVTMPYLVSFMRHSEIVVENRDFFIPLAFNAPVWEVTVGILPCLVLQKREWCAYPTVKKV